FDQTGQRPAMAGQKRVGELIPGEGMIPSTTRTDQSEAMGVTQSPDGRTRVMGASAFDGVGLSPADKGVMRDRASGTLLSADSPPGDTRVMESGGQGIRIANQESRTASWANDVRSHLSAQDQVRFDAQ